MSAVFCSDGDSFFAVQKGVVFKLDGDEWVVLKDTTPQMLDKFSPGLEDVQEVDLPSPFVAREEGPAPSTGSPAFETVLSQVFKAKKDDPLSF